GAGAPALARAAAGSLLARPADALAAIAAALRLGAKSDAGRLRHGFYAVEALVLASWMRQEKLVHVHAHFGTNSATVAMLAARVNGATFSMTVHGPEEFDKPAQIALAEKIRRSAFAAAVSSFGASQLRRLVAPEYWDRIRIVPCGVEKAFYEGLTPPPPAAPRFVCVGRLCEQKGQLTLIDAAAEVKKRGTEFELRLVGDGDMRGDIEAAIDRHGLGDRVKLIGWKTQSEVRKEIEKARALVLPSYAEGLPVSIMEAMVLGRPVISTYVAGIPELVVHGENGWLAPAGDAIALADAMSAAIALPEGRIAEMGRAAKARALARHDIDVVASTLKQLFAEVIAGREAS
ncbi:MAG: glycosyltransferase, partial [Parvularculaceae bacterium]|nr:glycosyltransferase [Parvularculaceae bacterium]